MEKVQKSQHTAGETDVKALFNATIEFSVAIKSTLELYQMRTIDLNQFLTRQSELADIHNTIYLKLTNNGEADLNHAISALSKDNATGETA